MYLSSRGPTVGESEAIARSIVGVDYVFTPSDRDQMRAVAADSRTSAITLFPGLGPDEVINHFAVEKRTINTFEAVEMPVRKKQRKGL